MQVDNPLLSISAPDCTLTLMHRLDLQFKNNHWSPSLPVFTQSTQPKAVKLFDPAVFTSIVNFANYVFILYKIIVYFPFIVKDHIGSICSFCYLLVLVFLCTSEYKLIGTKKTTEEMRHKQSCIF